MNGVAYNTSGTDPVYYKVVGANSLTYINGEQATSTTRFHLDLTQNVTIEFHEYQMITYTVTIANANLPSYPSDWSITLTKGDGTTVTPSAFGTYSEIVSMQVNGLAYVHVTESQTKWYYVNSTVGGT